MAYQNSNLKLDLKTTVRVCARISGYGLKMQILRYTLGNMVTCQRLGKECPPELEVDDEHAERIWQKMESAENKFFRWKQRYPQFSQLQ